MISLKVVAGRGRELVGYVRAAEGMLTSAGIISRVTPSTLRFEDGTSKRVLDGVTVRHTEAQKFGYPHAEGSHRLVVRHIRRGDKLIAA